MTESSRYQDSICVIDHVPDAARTGGEVIQLSDGRAGVCPVDIASGAQGAVETEGIFIVNRTASIVLTDGQPVYWDHSANTATYKRADDRDFFLGSAVGDSASTDTTIKVALNNWPKYEIDLQCDAFDTVIVKTVVGSTTVEVPDIKQRGGSHYMLFGATAEAQKVDLLSKRAFDVASNWIIEGEFNIVDDGSATAIDFNIGAASATHASDADAIAEHVFLHLDGNALDLWAQSKDGSTTVAAVDTTVNITLGTPVHFVFDGRTPGDVQIIVNGVLQLAATVFNLAAAVGPLKLLAHLEKSSDATIADYRVNYLRVRTAQQ